MGTGVDGSSEVQFGVFVVEGLFGHALMEGAVAVEKDHFGPVSEQIFSRIGREHPLSYLSVRPVDRTAVHALAALVTVFKSVTQIFACAVGPTDEVE